MSVPLSTAAPYTFHTVAVPTVNSNPLGILATGDGVYFTEYSTDKIGELSYNYVFGTETPLNTAAAYPAILATTNDGNIWFSENYGGSIGRITPIPIVPTTLLEWNDFLVPKVGTVGVVDDPTNTLWFVENANNSILRVTSWGSLLSRVSLSAGSSPVFPTVGPDNNSIWVTESGTQKIAKFNLSGTLVAEYASGVGYPNDITSGPDGNLYYTDNVTGPSYIGRMTPSGTVTLYKVPSGGSTGGITTGPDGNIWFMEYGNGAIAQLNITTHVINEWGLPDQASHPYPHYIVTGADGQLWFTEQATNKVGSFQP